MQSWATLGERRQESDAGAPDSRLRGWNFVLGAMPSVGKIPLARSVRLSVFLSAVHMIKILPTSVRSTPHPRALA